MIKKKTYNIAIVGLGNIGINLYRHLKNNKKNISKKNNINFNIKYVSAKNRFKKRKLVIPKNKWLKNYLDASKKRDIDIAYSILELFKRIDEIENFNKKALYILIREMTNVETAHITSVVNVLRKHYKKLLKHHLFKYQ